MGAEGRLPTQGTGRALSPTRGQRMALLVPSALRVPAGTVLDRDLAACSRCRMGRKGQGPPPMPGRPHNGLWNRCPSSGKGNACY